MILPKKHGKKSASEINFDSGIPHIVMDCGRRRISCHSYTISWILALFNLSVVITFGIQLFSIGLKNFYPDETAKYFLFAIPVLSYMVGLLLKIRLMIVPLMGVYIALIGLLWLLAGCLCLHSFFPSIFAYLYYNSQYHKFKYFITSYEERVVSFVFSLCLATVLMTISVFFIGSLHVMRKAYNYMDRKEDGRSPTYIPQEPIDFFDDEPPESV